MHLSVACEQFVVFSAVPLSVAKVPKSAACIEVPHWHLVGFCHKYTLGSGMMKLSM